MLPWCDMWQWRKGGGGGGWISAAGVLRKVSAVFLTMLYWCWGGSFFLKLNPCRCDIQEPMNAVLTAGVLVILTEEAERCQECNNLGKSFFFFFRTRNPQIIFKSWGMPEGSCNKLFQNPQAKKGRLAWKTTQKKLLVMEIFLVVLLHMWT